MSYSCASCPIRVYHVLFLLFYALNHRIELSKALKRKENEFEIWAVSKKPDHSNVESNLDSRLESTLESILDSRSESTLESNQDSNLDSHAIRVSQLI